MPFIILPNQLFKSTVDLASRYSKIVLLEEPIFFQDWKYPVTFHKQKLILHRASMKAHEDYLQQAGVATEYIEYADAKNYVDSSSNVTMYDPVDYELQKRFATATCIETPLFINSAEENNRYRQSKKRWHMADFYKHQRRRFDILMDGDTPVGRSWSFDKENRKKIPKNKLNDIPDREFPEESTYVTEARVYVNKNFPDALGSDTPFLYPVTFDQASRWLDHFIENCLERFGPYEDALVPQQSWLYHSVLTPMLNIGLLEPTQLVDRVIEKHNAGDIPLNSTEGFIRQVIGWREFMRATYQDLGVTMRTSNFWNHTTKIPQTFWNADTGITPIDDVIKRVLATGYCHHIERLMVLGGFMFLCEFDPKEIYKWFMEMFVDSYDWVMVPNVYAMSQHADGGLITTKPYFSGSAYLKKMGYSDTGEWCQLWDALYWRWILKHSDELRKNPRWAMMCSMADRMEETKKANHLRLAAEFLRKLEGHP